MLVVLLAVLTCLAFATVSASAATKVAAKAAKPAVKSTAKSASKPASKPFNQDEVLNKFWKASDSTVVGTVDGASVTKGELVKALFYWNGAQVLGDLLNQKMIEQAAKKAGVTITPAEQKQKEMEAVKRMRLNSVDELLQQFHIPKMRFTSSIRISALAEKAATKDLKITDAEYAEWVKARHILIRFPESETDKTKGDEAAKQKIDEIAAKIKAGEDFAKLADEYSEDPGNSADGVKKGGELGWFTKGKMVKEFENAAFGLKVGEVSEPVKTAYGYHIIKIDALGKDATGADKAEIKAMIMERKVPMEMQKWFANLQGKAKIDNKLQEPPAKEPTPNVKPNVAPKKSESTPPPPPAPEN